MQAALLVLVIYYVGEFFLNGRGPIMLKKKYVYILFCSTIMVGVGTLL